MLFQTQNTVYEIVSDMSTRQDAVEERLSNLEDKLQTLQVRNICYCHSETLFPNLFALNTNYDQLLKVSATEPHISGRPLQYKVCCFVLILHQYQPVVVTPNLIILYHRHLLPIYTALHLATVECTQTN